MADLKGFSLPADAPPEMAKAIEELLKIDPDILARLGAAIVPAMRQAFRQDSWPGNVDEWAESYVDVSRRMLEDRGQVEAIAVFLSIEDGELIETHIFTGRYMKNNATKDMLVGTLNTVANQTKAFATLFISEVWMVMEPAAPEGVKVDDDYVPEAKKHPAVVANNGSLEFHPERKEFVMLALETRAGVKMYQYEITRDENGKPSMSDENYGKDCHGYKGRFIGLLSETPEAMQ